ncbi:MAG: Alginate lyase [Massilia sp.]|nr:Alginate lyase [Massilia sp.]
MTAGVLLALAAPVALACGPAPKAVIDIDANSYYTDKHRSVIDPVLKARNVAAVKPIDDFLDVLARAASAYQASPAARAGEADCALQWMARWAGDQALLGKMTTRQSYYTRKWTLGGLALSYAKLKPAATGLQQRSIEAWLTALAAATIVHSDAHKGVRNNHYYWEGLAVTAAGAVTGDARLLAWGRKVFGHAMSQVAADGSLPLEMNRAVKALHYHLFAVTPLVMMASILDLRSPQLDSLVRFTLDGAADPAYIEKQTGFVQERATGPMSWKAIYARQVPGPASATTATSWQPRLGGDISIANPLEHVAR